LSKKTRIKVIPAEQKGQEESDKLKNEIWDRTFERQIPCFVLIGIGVKNEDRGV